MNMYNTIRTQIYIYTYILSFLEWKSHPKDIKKTKGFQYQWQKASIINASTRLSCYCTPCRFQNIELFQVGCRWLCNDDRPLMALLWLLQLCLHPLVTRFPTYLWNGCIVPMVPPWGHSPSSGSDSAGGAFGGGADIGASMEQVEQACAWHCGLAS